MESQSALSTVSPRENIWRLHVEMKNIQSVLAEHAERLLRLERRQDDDARLKSVWGTSSPFPTLLGSSTPQQGTQRYEYYFMMPETLTSFDQERQHSLLGSLQLDQDDLPRRGASRANSVRFDESAIQAHWMQGSRSSGDFYPTRTGSGLGGHPMTERSSSYKSDGRQSSAGHSVHSIHSARPNSLGLDTNFLLDQDPPLETSRPPPGLFILGPVPSIIRCWLNTNFSHETLLYAVVCTGSCKSLLDFHLVNHLGLKDQMRKVKTGEYKIKLPVYLPEAVVQQPSPRSSSPSSQLPALTVDFTVTNHRQNTSGTKDIQVFLGSDTLRVHSADVLLSQNTLTLFGDDHNKLSVPLVRPEDECLFTGLCTTNTAIEHICPIMIEPAPNLSRKTQKPTPIGVDRHIRGGSANGNDSGISVDEHIRLHDHGAQSPSPISSPVAIGSHEISTTGDAQKPGLDGSNHGDEAVISSAPPGSTRPSDPTDMARDEDAERRTSEDGHNDWSQRERETKADGENGLQSGPARELSGGVWASWRRDIGQDLRREGRINVPGDASSTGSGYQRPGRGRSMKVLRPSKPLTSSSSRSLSVSQTSSHVDSFSSTPHDGSRNQSSTKTSHESHSQKSRHSTVGNGIVTPETKEFRTPAKPRSANPVGGASAFAWLKPSQQKQPATTTE
ncbi:hypothetical protein FGG08_006341 [Glutinoglossum americanum]|uniref:Uncharacterized protein n=1 Tax=Glutinoglossum americanum TaxID=1670608 RepID=A0A9P8KV22_9PEZI|nr:hypothetical protein FGG08_006341 [Glutinoglossum americanum]